jgi:hypothetical protein
MTAHLHPIPPGGEPADDSKEDSRDRLAVG